MKTQTLSSVLALASVQLVSAGWLDASSYSCPGNTNNHCNPQQHGGFDWNTLGLGSFNSYGGFSFDGFSCASSFGGSGKRDVLSGRTFQDKCITGSASHEPHNSPSFSCGGDSEVPAFSVDEFQISVEFDCQLEFHYGMPDGSNCKQKSSCSKSGTTIKNSQCGGAKNVSIVYPSQPGGKSSCSVGVHSIGFDCGSTTSSVHHYPTTSPAPVTTPTYAPTTPASTTSYPVYTPSTTPSSSQGVETTPSTSAEYTPSTTPSSSQGVETTPSTSAEYTPSTTSSSSEGVETTPATSAEYTPSTTSSSGVETTPATSAEYTPSTTSSSGVETTPATSAEYTPSTTSSSGVETTPATSPSVSSSETSSAVVSSSSQGVETTPGSSAGITTLPSSAATSSGVQSTPASSTPEEVITTEIIYTSTTICPVTATQTSNGVTSVSTGVSTSTIVITTTSTICTKCQHASSSAGVATTSTTPSGPVTTASCPSILPQCLNTWLFTTECDSNTDSDCFCPSSSFVSSVYECLSAHGDSSEIPAAQAYFQGICAAHIGSNPAIVTCATGTSGGALATSVPVTTIEIVKTLVVPCTESTGISSGSVIPFSSTTSVLSTAVTVPQVIFTTVPGASTPAAALVAGTTTPAAAAGVTTGYPAQTTISTIAVSNSTAKPTSTPAAPFTGAGSRNSMAMGSIAAALLLAMAAM